MMDPGLDTPKNNTSYLEFLINQEMWNNPDEILYAGKDEFNNTALTYLLRHKRKRTEEFLEKATSEALSFACLEDPHSLRVAAREQTTEIFYQFVNKLSSAAISHAIQLHDDRGMSALHLAMLNHSTGDLETLINKTDSAALNSVLQIDANVYGTPLHIAGFWKKNKSFMKLVERAAANVISKIITIRGWQRTTLLHAVIYNQPWEALVLLINKTHAKEFAAALQMKDLVGGWTILHYLGRDDQAGDILFLLTDKADFATIHQALSAAHFYKKTFLEIKKNNTFNFIYLIFIHAFSYLIGCRSEKNFQLENEDWASLLLNLSNSESKNYCHAIKEHIKANGNFWGGLFGVRYKDIRNLLLELPANVDPNIIKRAITQSAIFLINKLNSIMDSDIQKIIQQHLSPITKITGDIKKTSAPSQTNFNLDHSKHTYAESLDLFRADPKFIRNSSKREKIGSKKEESEQKEKCLDSASHQKQREKKPASGGNWVMWQEDKTKTGKEGEINEADSASNIDNVSL